MTSSAVVAQHVEGSSVGWSFWLRWFLACLAGFVVGIPLFIGLGQLFGDIAPVLWIGQPTVVDWASHACSVASGVA